MNANNYPRQRIVCLEKYHRKM